MRAPVAIIAGGMATRLHPMTLKVPKSMVLVKGKPFIFWQLTLLAKSSVNKVVLCLGHMSEEIYSYVGDGRQFGLSVEYSIEEYPLGTGGALLHAKSLLGDYFGILYGDSYLQIDYSKVEETFFASRNSMLMTIYKNFESLEPSNVEYVDGKVLAYSKKHQTTRMKYIDYGFSVAHSSIFDYLSQIPSGDLSDLQAALSADGLVGGLVIKNRYHEVGSFEGIQALESSLPN